MSSYLDPSERRPPRGGCLIVTVLAILAIAGVWLVWRLWPEHSGLNPQAQPRVVTPRGSLSELEDSNIAIYEKVSPCLVQVTNLSEQRGNWFSLDVQEVPKGVGSGFVWDKQGHIVTNYHVVEGADAAQVTLADHATYNARQIWAYPDQDIAVLWIERPAGQAPADPHRHVPRLEGGSNYLRPGRPVRPRSDDDRWDCQRPGSDHRVRQLAAPSPGSSRPARPSTRAIRAAPCLTAPGGWSA